MGKCVSRQTTTTCHGLSLSSGAGAGAAHHQSVLTIALSQPDLAQAHKIWQQLTASNEYIAATSKQQQEEAEQPEQPEQAAQSAEQAPAAEPSFYYHRSHNKAQWEEEQQQQQQELPVAESVQAEQEYQQQQQEEEEELAAVLHIESPLSLISLLCLFASLSSQGQSESKKHGGGGKSNRRHNGNNPGQQQSSATAGEQAAQQLHTKGTAMSFGFRKKLNGTPKKFKKLLEATQTKDDNGNATETETATPTPVQFEKVGAAAQKANASNRTGAAGKRFGYRGSQVPRPASAGLTTQSSASEEVAQQNNNNNNNNGNGNNAGSNNGNNNNGNNTNANGLVSNLKRRSKSAHAGRASDGDAPKIATQPKTLTFNLNQNTTIEYQRRQFFGEIADESMASAAGTTRQAAAPRYNYNNLANMHANVIVRPTPRAAPASFAKFTLQTVSLPRPEYPVAISLNATTPTTPSSSSVQSPVPAVPAHATGARAKEINPSNPSAHRSSHPLRSIHAQAAAPGASRQLDQKSVKQLTNNSTRRGFSGSREISADSGIASMDMAVDSAGSSSGSSACSGSKRSRSRPRNLQMVMSGRHTFEVRDMDDPPSSESNSFVETLALPKLPTDNSQTTPLPLVGLVRSNTVLSRESYERRQTGAAAAQEQPAIETPPKPKPSGSDDSESVDEEKLYLDSSTSEKSAKQQSQSQSEASSMSWRCQAGESLAARDCSSLTLSSEQQASAVKQQQQDEVEDMSLDELSLINTELDVPFSSISSISEPQAKSGADHLLNNHNSDNNLLLDNRDAALRPRSFNNALNESKFAELALANSSCLLLEDETSPTDSLVSSTEESEAQAAGKLKKHKLNAELQQQQLDNDAIDVLDDIDDISPVLEELELDVIAGSRSRSPLSPGTPTHASHSLSLGSDCGNLIDDEIADQPGLLCNSSEAQELATDTPTLMESHTGTAGGNAVGTGTGSLRSLKSQSKARTALQQAIELSLRTPAAVRRAVLESAESLDTLSPCESICSDDLMMDFDLNSSVDSIDRGASLRSRSGSDLHKLGTELELELNGDADADTQAETEAELLSQLECKGSDVMKELNSLLRVRLQRTVSSPRERISAKLPARATRLLNRSRLQDQQQQQHQHQHTGNDSDNSLRSTHSGASGRKRSSNAASRASTASSSSSLQRRQQQHQHQQQHHHHPLSASGSTRRTTGNAELHSSSDDLMLYDKSFRNAMIQDVLQFKKQLLRLRRILQEVRTSLPLTPAFPHHTETLNPFENDNVQLFAACGLDSKQLNDIDLASLTSSTTEDPLQELSDLRRQVVYLQGQVDDRDRTIRLQRDLIEQLEAERRQATAGDVTSKERISMATQTERTRPLAIGAEGLSRSKPEYTSYTTHFPTLHLHCNDSTLAATTIIRHQQQQEPCNGHSSNNNCSNNNNNNNNCRALSQTRRHTIISTTLTNYNQQLAAAAYPRRASIAWDAAELSAAATPTTATVAHKPVRITLIGEPLPLPKSQQQKPLQQQSQQQAAATQQQNGVKTRFLNGGSCNGSSAQGTHPYQPLYNSNKMTNPSVTIV
ncbi:hypothetical protein KR222_006043 [Zaprionus bogoriensis]|nr:hypothetical protein KR222_006043 [Zaprionus bogoriensis]